MHTKLLVEGEEWMTATLPAVTRLALVVASTSRRLRLGCSIAAIPAPQPPPRPSTAGPKWLWWRFEPVMQMWLGGAGRRRFCGGLWRNWGYNNLWLNSPHQVLSQPLRRGSTCPTEYWYRLKLRISIYFIDIFKNTLNISKKNYFDLIKLKV